MHPLTTDLAEQILALIKVQSYSLLGAVQDNKTVLGGSAGSGGGVGNPPAGFVGQLTQSNVTYDTAGSSRACIAGSSGSSSLVDNLDAIRLGTEICDDAIGDRHIDWGTGAGQVSAIDVPFATTSGSIDATNVRDAIEETYSECYGTGGSGVSDHGALTGLADDDHTQYLLADGTRALSGPWDVGAQLVTFGAGVAFDGATSVNELAVPGGLAIALEVLDTNTIEYLRIDTAPQLEVIWNMGRVDIDFRVDANEIWGALWIEGLTGNVYMDKNLEIAGGQLSFTLAAGSVISILDSVDPALTIIDGGPVEYLRIDTAPQLEVIWNNGEADVDFRVAASAITNAFFVQGSDGYVGLGTGAPDEMLHLLSAASTEPVLLLENTNADALAHVLEFYKNSAGPADNDDLGAIDFYGETSTGVKERYAYILGQSLDVTNGDTGGSLRFQVVMDATERNLLEIAGYNGSVNEGEVIVNEAGQDVDFRVEAAGVVNALFVEGSTGYVGVGLAAPQGHFHQFGAISGVMHWEYNGLAGVAQTIIPNAAGDVTEMIYVQSVVTEVTGAGREGHTSWVEPGGSQIIYDDGVDTVTLSVAAAGNVTIVRTAGADTFKVSLWLMWI